MNHTESPCKPEFGFQWHITNRCNLRCAHCYQEGYSASNEPDNARLVWIADQMIETLASWNKLGDVAVTGGEPFVRNDLFGILRYLESAGQVATLDVLTNGTLINDQALANLRKLTKLRCVQVSLDGARPETNDVIRGKGVFDKVLATIRKLTRVGIPVNVMFTLHTGNVGDVPGMIDLAIANGVSTLTIERLTPIGNAARAPGRMLPPADVERVFGYVAERSSQLASQRGATSISMSRPLWALCNCGSADGPGAHGGVCSVGLDGLCILPDAKVLACRRLPIPIGDLRKDSFRKIWHRSELLWEIADKRNLKGKCNSCEFVNRCAGCRAIAYAVTGDYLAGDPQCWKT